MVAVINNDSENEEEQQELEEETYLAYYLRQRGMWISISLSIYLILDILALFLTANYTFRQVFLYFGILMILIATVTIFFVTFEEDLYWALVSSLVLGLIPAIEIIVHLAMVGMDTASLILAILCLILTISLIPLPVIMRAWYFSRKRREQRIPLNNESSNEAGNETKK